MIFLFVLVQYKTLGQLRARLDSSFPGAMAQIWRNIPLIRRWSIFLLPAVFTTVKDRIALLDLFVARPDHIPAWMMGDDTVADLVFKLNHHWSASLFRTYFQLTTGVVFR